MSSQGPSPVATSSHLCRSAQDEEQRGPGHGGHGQVLPSLAPQLSRASPHGSFPSS